jgi:hypothetical protein
MPTGKRVNSYMPRVRVIILRAPYMVLRKPERPRGKGPVPDAHQSCNPIGDKEMCSHAFGPPQQYCFFDFDFSCSFPEL